MAEPNDNVDYPLLKSQKLDNQEDTNPLLEGWVANLLHGHGDNDIRNAALNSLEKFKDVRFAAGAFVESFPNLGNHNDDLSFLGVQDWGDHADVAKKCQ